MLNQNYINARPNASEIEQLALTNDS